MKPAASRTSLRPILWCAVGMVLVGAPVRAQTPERLTSGTALGTPREPSGSALAPSSSGLVLFAVEDHQGTELWRTDLTSEGTRLVKDIHPGPASSSPGHLTTTGGAWLFSADDGVHGRELWRSDGTAAGTRMVKDVRAGSVSSSPGECGREGLATAQLGGAAYFFADDGVHGAELWRTDGTEGGTFLLKDIRPGAAASQGGSQCWQEMLALGGKLYFVANDGVHGAELWRTDGTASGTRLFEDTRPGSADDFGPWNLTVVGSRLFFNADDQLWSSDGTGAGTAPVARIVPWNTIVPLGGRAFFGAAGETGKDVLWVSDGTPAGTRVVSDLGGDGMLLDLAVVGERIVLFVARPYTELWVSDGTTTGTRFVAAIQTSGEGFHFPDALTPVGGTLYFMFAAESPGDAEPWRSDGTAAGTRRVRDLRPGPEGSWSDCWACAYPRMVPAGGGIVFFADDGASGDALWKSDGTESGTTLLGSWLAPPPIAPAGEGLFFVAGSGSSGFELWRTEPRTGIETLVKDIRPGGASSAPADLTAVGDILYFTADDGESGRELWRSDGTEAGTVRVLDIWPGPVPSAPRELTGLGDLLLFSAEDAAGRELWRSDGTQAGTLRVLDIGPGVTGSSPGRMTVSGSFLYFVAGSPDSPIAELWRTDGTAAGTLRLTDLRSASATVAITEIEDVGGGILFATAGNPEGLWRSDGTVAGTFLVKTSLPPGPSQLTAVDGRAFFTAAPSPDAAAGNLALWVSDGTAGGTRLVRDFGAEGSSASPGELTGGGDRLLFTVHDDEHGRELWTSDGTAEGTRLVADIRPGPEDSAPAELAALWDESYMAADDGMLGRELWTSDGTADGTRPVADIQTGPEGSSPTQLTAEGGALYFAADDGGGPQLWWLPAAQGLVVQPASVTEGDSGTVDAVFKVSLLSPSTQPVTVDFATVDGSATAGSDYEACAGSLVFAPGDREHDVVVRVNGDDLLERDETFLVEISKPQGAPITHASATGRIRDDDGALVRLTLPGGATGLSFAAILRNGSLEAVTGPQSAELSFLSAPAAWSVEATTTGAGEWLRAAPGGGNGPATVRFEVADSGSFVPGTFRARARFGGPEILNEAVVDVTLTVSSAPSAAPFGFLDTPQDAAADLQGAVAVTGWALDDVEVSRVGVYRDPMSGEPTGPNGKVYIGDATLVPGARPDVAAAYPTYPNATRAGWGYMLLTNMLPGQGNGPFTLHAYAHDPEGHVTLLGSKTITCTNATATRPFGAIDTPAQGQNVSGSAYAVFGWVLTPQPATIPIDGSTIWVYVDGAPLGHPTYNLYRSDIATLFPGYANTNGAVGLFVLDTTALANGLHTIAWSVTDDQSRSDGIGSRYFWVQN